MTQTEAIRTIAEYDGQKVDYIPLSEMADCFDYATNISSLYFVAGRVIDDVYNLNTGGSTIKYIVVNKIKTALLTFSPDLTPLLMAVADGVELINQYNIN